LFARTPARLLAAGIAPPVTLPFAAWEIPRVAAWVATPIPRAIPGPVTLPLTTSVGPRVAARLAAVLRAGVAARFGARLGPPSAGDLAALQAQHDPAQFVQLPLVARLLDLGYLHDLQDFLHRFKRLAEGCDDIFHVADELVDGFALRLGLGRGLAG
jgi:hypothetical protein